MNLAQPSLAAREKTPGLCSSSQGQPPSCFCSQGRCAACFTANKNPSHGRLLGRETTAKPAAVPARR